jgi:hypothetical protein
MGKRHACNHLYSPPRYPPLCTLHPPKVSDETNNDLGAADGSWSDGHPGRASGGGPPRSRLDWHNLQLGRDHGRESIGLARSGDHAAPDHRRLKRNALTAAAAVSAGRRSGSEGRVAGAKTLTISKIEILTGLNKPDEFILAMVIVDQETPDVRQCRPPFEREPDFKATSVNHDLAKLLALAKEPA